MRAGVIGDDPRQGRFANARGAMQDQVADPISLDRAPQQSSVGKDSLLTLEFLQGAGTHPVGQGGLLPSPLFSLISEEVLAQRCIGDSPVSSTSDLRPSGQEILMAPVRIGLFWVALISARASCSGHDPLNTA